MFLTRWRKHSAYSTGRRLLEKEGLYGTTLQSIEHLLTWLDRYLDTEASRESLKTHRLASPFRTVDELIVETHQAALVIAHDAVIPKRTEAHRFHGSLDDYLVTVQHYPLTLAEVYPKLKASSLALFEPLALKVSEEDIKVGYYLRHYQKLLTTHLALLEALVSVSW